jgi:hypothetical protein
MQVTNQNLSFKAVALYRGRFVRERVRYASYTVKHWPKWPKVLLDNFDL